MREKELAAFLQQYKGRPLKLMEVCGTHTSALYRTGLRQLLPENITLVSGPGCPVCVTPTRRTSIPNTIKHYDKTYKHF